MATLVERGFAIGRIAKLSDGELTEMLSEHMDLDQAGNNQHIHEALASAEAARAQEIMGQIHASLARFDLAAIHTDLLTARYLLGARGFALDLVAPLMDLVGRMTVSGRLSLAQEHALSAIVKAHLAGIALDMPRRPQPAETPTPGLSTFVITTMEGNYHEIGIMIAGMLCALRGLPTFYLGPSLPPGALAEAVTAFKADKLVIGTTPMPMNMLPVSEADYLVELDKRLPKTCEIWVGGAPSDLKHARLKRPLRFLRSLREFDEAVLALTAQTTGS